MHTPSNLPVLSVPSRPALPFFRRKHPPQLRSATPSSTITHVTLASAPAPSPLCPPRPLAPRRLRLSDLPDDVLTRLITTLMSPVAVGPHRRIVETSFRAALPLTEVSRRFHALFHACLHDLELWQSGRITDRALLSLSLHATDAVRRLVLRKCPLLSTPAVAAAVAACPRLRALDLSHAAIPDAALFDVLRAAPRLTTLLLRGCARLTDGALRAIAALLPRLEALDVGACARITDAGVAAVAAATHRSLAMIVLSDCPLLTDAALHALAHCARLQVVTLRRAARVSDAGVAALCRGVRDRLAVLDVLDCSLLTAHGVLGAAQRYCPTLAGRLQRARGMDLRQMVIASLSGLIFHVTGSDVRNGKAAVYFLLVDSGTSNSFRVSVGSSSLDLTNYGSILASCFGEAPNEHVKRTLLNQYGLDLDSGEDKPAEADL